GASGRETLAASGLRASAGPAGAGAHAAAESARRRVARLSTAQSLAYRVRPAAGDAEGALVLFHGRGADEHDLFPLLDLLDPERRRLGATPRGPLALPPGGAHWYVVPRVGFPDPSTFQSSYALASSWLDSFADETGI